MAPARTKRRINLRLVEPSAPADLPPILTDPAARKEFAQLTQALVDIAIEVVDLVEGDPDLEPNGDEVEGNGDEFEDGDGGL